eukprot:scaffold3733_cov53-Phaeocystis_antarctica.AAC.4
MAPWQVVSAICGADLARVVLGVRTGLARTAGRVGGRTSFSSTILELRRSHLGAASIGSGARDERAAQ